MVKLALLLVLLGGTAAADPCCDDPTDQRAKDHLERGRERHDAKEYELAIAEYKAGYVIEKLGVFLFAIAQSERAWGKCADGDAHFKQWLAMNPPLAIREKAEAALEPCTPEPVVKPPPRNVKPQPPSPPAPPWYRDTLGGVITSAGVASLGVGVTFGILANRSTRAASHASTIDRYDELIDKGKSRKTIAVIGIGVGGALVVTGVLRYAIEMRSNGDRRVGRGRARPRLIGWLDGRGGGLVVAKPW